MSGQFDPITPPSYGDRAAATLSRSFVYTLPGEGHGASISDCGLDILASFWQAPLRRPDARCLASLTGPAWVLPGDDHPLRRDR